MRALLIATLVAIGFVFAASAELNYTNLTNEELVSQLTEIDSPVVGLHSTAWVRVFIVDDLPPGFTGGILGSVRPKTFPQMQELVRRGTSALPILIQHLDDKRPTKLKAGKEFDFRYFSDEYDPKRQENNDQEPLKRRFHGDYTVKVGDVCYVLIGQIVNRNLCVFRYQPTMGLVVNSPIEAPILIKKVKKDWGKLDKKAHLGSLLADARLNSDWWYKPALQRLRFYYPEEYRRQKTGKLKDKIAELEFTEKTKPE